MKKMILELSGIFIFLAGFIFFINYLSGITGYVAINEINEEFSSIAGIVLIVGGLILFITGRHVQADNKIVVNKEKGIRKMRIAVASGMISYEKFKRIIIESGYNVVETKDYTTVFTPEGEVIKDEIGYPLTISKNRKEDKKLLIQIFKKIIEGPK